MRTTPWFGRVVAVLCLACVGLAWTENRFDALWITLLAAAGFVVAWRASRAVKRRLAGLANAAGVEIAECSAMGFLGYAEGRLDGRLGTRRARVELVDDQSRPFLRISLSREKPGELSVLVTLQTGPQKRWAEPRPALPPVAGWPARYELFGVPEVKAFRLLGRLDPGLRQDLTDGALYGADVSREECVLWLAAPRELSWDPLGPRAFGIAQRLLEAVEAPAPPEEPLWRPA